VKEQQTPSRGSTSPTFSRLLEETVHALRQGSHVRQSEGAWRRRTARPGGHAGLASRAILTASAGHRTARGLQGRGLLTYKDGMA
jgi:hypothetical protein